MQEANSIAETLVREEIAACVNILPQLTSVYRWEGKVETANEVLMVMKTRDSLFETLRMRVLELHPYEVPEIIAIPIASGHPPYMDWIEQSTRSH